MSAAALGLGEACGVAELVPGDPVGVRHGAATLRAFGVELAEAADVVAAARVQEWTGAAARVFRAARAEQPKRLREAADAFAHAAAALSFYADVLDDAQSDAARALALWADGEHATAVWRAQQARALASGVRVGRPGGWDSVAAWGEDPGLPDRQQAQRVLASARDSLAYEAAVTGNALDDAAAEAPSKPGWLSSAWRHIANGADDLWHGAERGATDVWHGAEDVAHFVADHPAEIVKALEDAAQIIAGVAAVAIGEAAIDGGVVISATGVGAVAGLPLAAVGVAAIGAGIGVGIRGAESLGHDINQMRAEATTEASGSSGAGASTEDAVERTAIEAAENAQIAKSEVGAIRECAVARLTGGRVLGEPGEPGMEVVQPEVGKTDVDVLGPNGEYIAVGGPAKAANLAKLGQKLSILKYAARQAQVPAQAYFARGTPQSVIDIAKRILGNENVFEFGP